MDSGTLLCLGHEENVVDVYHTAGSFAAQVSHDWFKKFGKYPGCRTETKGEARKLVAGVFPSES